jgi:hypothetical protein
LAHRISRQRGGGDSFELFTKAVKGCLKLAYGCCMMAKPPSEPQAGVDWLAQLARTLARAHELRPDCEPALALVSKGVVELHIEIWDGRLDEYLDSAHHAALVVGELVLVGAYQVLGLPVPRACLWQFPRNPKSLLYASELVFPTAENVAARHKALGKHWQRVNLTQELFNRLWASIRLESQAAGAVDVRLEGNGTPDTGALSFSPGLIVYRGHPKPLTGKPWGVSKALSEAHNLTCTLKQLQDSVWPDSNSGEEAVRSAVSDARVALRSVLAAAGIKRPPNPLPTVDQGSSRTAWRLDIP